MPSSILDVKRGDIGSTAQGYADAYLDPTSPLAVDAITVSPFLGLESVQPFVDVARRNDAGLFLLALTSNPGAGQVQHAASGDRTVAGAVLARLAELERRRRAARIVRRRGRRHHRRHRRGPRRQRPAAGPRRRRPGRHGCVAGGDLR